MQTKSKFYKLVGEERSLHTASFRTITTIPTGSLFLVVEQDPDCHVSYKVIFNDLIGWIDGLAEDFEEVYD